MRILNRNTIVAFLLGSALTIGAGAFAVDRQISRFTSGDANAHAERMLKHLYVEVDATEAQKALIAPLVHKAIDDMQPLHSQLHTAPANFMKMLSQPVIDRAALESSRSQNLQLVDQASRRLVQLAADVGDVLTPAQRQQLSEHLGKLHQHHHG